MGHILGLLELKEAPYKAVSLLVSLCCVARMELLFAVILGCFLLFALFHLAWGCSACKGGRKTQRLLIPVYLGSVSITVCCSLHCTGLKQGSH